MTIDPKVLAEATWFTEFWLRVRSYTPNGITDDGKLAYRMCRALIEAAAEIERLNKMLEGDTRPPRVVRVPRVPFNYDED